uniref:Capsid protein n=1 Tax=Cressdnaviricota sp. TaxID=2748378 RepID=A0A6M4B8T0_9VIRU|nr:capsid protein [Cressdnaviricota sp.]
MVPAANLPVDPLGLTGVQGTTDLMDPRDTLNPIMFHGAHGENMSNVIDNFYANHGNAFQSGGITNATAGFVSDSADQIQASNPVADNNYYRFLTDPTWRKFGIQSGVRLSRLVPLTWRLTRSIPLLPSYEAPATGVIRGSGTSGSVDSLVANGNANPAPANTFSPIREAPAIQNIGGGGSSMGFVQELLTVCSSRLAPYHFFC